MAGMVISNRGRAVQIGSLAAAIRYVVPFVNDRSPMATDTIDDYVEPQNQYYARGVISPDEWSMTPEGAVHRGITFNFVGPIGVIYGVAYFDDEMNFLVGNCFYDPDGKPAPVNYSQYGGKLLVVPAIKAL